MLEGQNFVYGGNRPWKNASWQNFLDPKPQLTARRPFVVKKWPFKALFSHPPSGRHRACSYNFLPSNSSYALSIWEHLKNFTRPLPERPFFGRFLRTPRWKKRFFVIFGRRFWLTQLQSGQVGSVIFKLLSSSYRAIKNLTLLCEKCHLIADFYYDTKKLWPKNLFKALLSQLRLADTELAASRFYRQIKALPLVIRDIFKS